MCIVIDTNSVAAVLDPAHQEHSSYGPVLKWVLQGKGKFVYGGTRYRVEVFEKMARFRRFFLELSRQRKAVTVPKEDVDREEARVRALEPSPEFDDPHLVAIIEASGCQLLCSGDKRSDRFVKDRRFYQRHAPPRIFRSAEHHQQLLVDENIATCCRPDHVLGRAPRDALKALLPCE